MRWTRKQDDHLRHEFLARMGNDRKLVKQVTGLLRNFVDPLVHGRKQKSDHPPLHNNTKVALEAFRTSPHNGWRLVERLRQKDWKRHILLGGTSPLHQLWYTSRVVSHDGKRFCLLQFDVDFHRAGKSDAAALAKRLETIVGRHRCYWEVSTNGRGVHFYVIIEFPRSSSAAAIVDWSKELGRTLSTAFPKYQAVCGEVLGTPTIWMGKTVTRMGDLARLPLLPTAEDASRFAFMESLEQSECDGLFPRSILEPQTTQAKQQGVVRKHTVKKSGKALSAAAPSADATKPTTRMNLLVAEMFRTLLRAPTVEEVLAEYEARNLHTGQDRDGNRRYLAKSAIAHFAASFDISKSQADPLVYLPLIQSNVSDDQLKAAYRKGRLRHGDVAVAYWVAYRKLSQHGGQTTIPRDYFLNAFANLNEQSHYGRKLDSNKLAAIKRILNDVGLLLRVRHGRKGGGADLFRIGPVRP